MSFISAGSYDNFERERIPRAVCEENLLEKAEMIPFGAGVSVFVVKFAYSYPHKGERGRRKFSLR